MLKDFNLFKNSRKEKPNHPDFIISIKVDDTYKEIGGAWMKESKGVKYLSCRLGSTNNYQTGYSLTSDVVPELGEVPIEEVPALSADELFDSFDAAPAKPRYDFPGYEEPEKGDIPF